MRPAFGAALAAAIALGGCHLALGLEEAEEIEGAGGNCTAASECGDGNPCTDNLCEDGQCLNPPLDGDLPADAQTTGDCRRQTCVAGEVTSTTDAADVLVDGKECTDDLCDGNQPANPPKAAGTACGDGTLVCDGDGDCVECFENDQCTPPDTCGGGGPPGQCGCDPSITCGTLGLTCGGGGIDDCSMAIQCSNGIQDGTETDVDCGGPQPMMGGSCAILCGEGKSCVNDTDCVPSTVCDANGMCAPPP